MPLDSPSPKALSKAQAKRTGDNEPVHSFRSLLKDLATLAKNQVRSPVKSKTEAAEFEMLTTPTPLQRRAFELLEVRIGK